MKRSSIFTCIVVLFAVGIQSEFGASGGVTLYTDNFAAWQGATGSYSTCDFVGFPVNTQITTQYSELGAIFTPFQGPNIVQPYSDFIFPEDGYGIDGNGDVEILFDTPMHSLAAHAPGSWRYQLFSGDTMFHQSVYVGGGGAGFFAGLVSTQAFTKIRFDTFDFDDVYIDNVYFSAAPGPGGAGLGLVGLVLAKWTRRRGRREC